MDMNNLPTYLRDPLQVVITEQEANNQIQGLRVKELQKEHVIEELKRLDPEIELLKKVTSRPPGAAIKNHEIHRLKIQLGMILLVHWMGKENQKAADEAAKTAANTIQSLTDEKTQLVHTLENLRRQFDELQSQQGLTGASDDESDDDDDNGANGNSNVTRIEMEITVVYDEESPTLGGSGQSNP